MKKLKKQLRNTKANIARFEAVSRNSEEIKKIIQNIAGDIPGATWNIRDVKIKPIKVYRDSVSFSFAGVYEFEIVSSTGILRKKVFAVSHSDETRRTHYLVNQAIFNYAKKNQSSVLTIPRPYGFIKPYNLFLREYIEGQSLNILITERPGLPSSVLKTLASAIDEFQKVKIPPFIFKAVDNDPIAKALGTNIMILKEKNHPRWRDFERRFKKINIFFKKAGLFEKNENITLSHGDLNPTNIILNSDGRLTFLDFGWTAYRHFLWDIAGFSSHLGILVKTASTVLESKMQQKLFLDAYLKKTGRILNENDKKLFKILKEYFDLLNLTHSLIWG